MERSRGVMILHVDGEDKSVADIGNVLETRRSEFEVLTVETGEDALDTLDTNAVDCVVSSDALPDMDGVGLLEQVRETHPNVPVVLLGEYCEETASRAIAAGVTDYLPRDILTGDNKSKADGFDTLVYAVERGLEESRQRQELRRYRQFIEHVPDTIAVLDEYLSVIYQSPASPELAHEPVRVAEEGGLFEHIHPDDMDRVGDALEQLLADPDSVVTLVCRAEAAGGEWRWVEARAQNYLGQEPVDGILVSVRDVTQRKQREETLTRYGQTLETLQETTTRLLDESDPEEVAALTMSSVETVLEFEAAGMWLAADTEQRLEPVASTVGADGVIDEIPTYTPEDESLSWEAYSDNSVMIIDDMREYEGRHNPETQIRSELIVPLGEYGLLNIGTTEIDGFTDRDRTLVELWAGTVTTVLERLEREQELRDRESEIARERDRLDSFASVVSHDLRNPLHVASSRLELLADESESEHVQAASNALDRMERLIEDLLVLAREGQTVHDPGLVDLRDVAEESWTTARTAQATLVCETDQTVRADRNRLRQVFENLFRNATEHAGPEATVTVGALPGGFYIEDDGPGIPESELDRVFESGYSTSDGGNGLGLSIVRQILTAHGWEVRATDGEHGGARFEVTGVEVF